MHPATCRWVAAHRWVAALCLVATGCQQLDLGASSWTAFRPLSSPEERSQNPDEELLRAPDETGIAVETDFVGDYVTIAGLNVVVLRGVGLVVGLDGTGGDPPPSMYRNILMEDMRKRNVTNPNAILASPNTAIVAIRAYLPPLVRKGDRFDVELVLPDNGSATSLRGGYLLQASLSEQAIVQDRGVLNGHEFARAEGPILISTGEGDEDSLAGVMRRGRVLGGGASLKDRHMAIFLRNDFRSGRNSKRLAARIGQRFFSFNSHGLREPLAEAKTDQQIELKIHPRYQENFPRFLQVIRALSFNETPVEERIRMQLLEDRLNTPQAAERAALELEAIGTNGVPILEKALHNPSLEVRFHAAVALAYLGEDTGLTQLAEAARQEPAFRVYALAAMATLQDSAAPRHLIELMNEPSAETRYGAFRALFTLDPSHPSIAGEILNEEFRVHPVASTGTPLIHLTHKSKQEIVLFDAEQRFSSPLYLQAGTHIEINASSGSGTVIVSRHEAGKSIRKETSTRVLDVIRAAAECGASYPDIAQMLVQAEKGHNLPGHIEIDALPRAGRYYSRPKDAIDQVAERETQIGRSTLVPNLFATDDEGSPRTTDEADSATDAKTTNDDEKSDTKQSVLLQEEEPWYDVRKYFLDPKTP